MSVISNRQKMLDQILHKDNIANCVRGEKGPIGQGPDVVSISVGKSMSDRTAIMHTPEDIKILAGALFITEGAAVAAEVSGLSKNLTRIHGKGLTTRTRYDEDLAEKVLEKKEELAAPAREKALNIILNAMNTITPEKLEQAKLREASSVAKDMASVIEKLADKNNNNGNSISFHFHAPRERKEDEYVVKDV